MQKKNCCSFNLIYNKYICVCMAIHDENIGIAVVQGGIDYRRREGESVYIECLRSLISIVSLQVW